MADGSGEGRDALSGRRGPDGTGSGVAEQGLAVAEHHGESTHGKEENVDSLDLARSGASARAESDPMVRSRPIHEATHRGRHARMCMSGACRMARVGM